MSALSSIFGPLEVVVNAIINMFKGLGQAIYFITVSYAQVQIMFGYLPSIIYGFAALGVLITIIYFIIGRQG